jgi:hypothetical protein
MGPTTRKLLQMQGYSEATLCDCKGINLLARWTPFACATFGLVGLFLASSYYMFTLGLLTTIGAFSTRSVYDHFYMLLVRPVADFGEMPRHGNQRRFGCAIGSILYLLSGVGFASGNGLLAYASSVTIIALAFVAAMTQWCFASTLYNVLFSMRTTGLR